MSLIHLRPVEMHIPKKITLLLFVERGWVGKYQKIWLPHRPADDFNWSRSCWRINKHLSGMSPVLKDWRDLGAVRKIHVNGCKIQTTYAITDCGKAVLRECPPEILADARALYRAIIWDQIVANRHRRRMSAFQAQGATARVTQ